jgi:hypothetical protein
MFARNVVNDIPDYTESHVRRRLAYNHHSKNYVFHFFLFLVSTSNFKFHRDFAVVCIAVKSGR